MLTPAQVAEFERDGVVVLPGFYDLARDILPIWQGIYEIIGLVARRAGIALERPPVSGESFDAGYASLIEADRSLGGLVYDAVKQLPAFVRLVASPRHDDVMARLRPGSLPGLAGGGYGIRIDNPGEDRYRAAWHQEYPAQLRSVDGLVFWSSLVPLTPELGPVRFALGSHREGLVPVLTQDADHPERAGAYALRLSNETERLARYPRAAPLTGPGDLVVVDFLTLHASGVNRGARSRWSMQMRYFNFREPTGLQHGWRGSFAAGVRLGDVHPELVADP